jgi:hypothetical protein
VKTLSQNTNSRLPASRFPEPAELYFCDNCGRDLTKNLFRDRAPVWQPLRPMWCVCDCGRKYLSGAAEWDDLSTWEREQRIRQLGIGFVLFALLVIPVTLAYFALRYGGAALLAVVGIALIPSILVAKPFGFVLVDLYEIAVSVCRTRALAKKVSPVTTIRQWIMRCRPQRLRLSPVGLVIATLIIATRWIPSHLDAASPVSSLLSPETLTTAPQETLLAPARLALSPVVQDPEIGAPSPAFKRVQIGPNEIDYVSDDVTVRHFTPTSARPRGQLAHKLASKEIHFGADVTLRYFSPKAAVSPEARPVSLDRSMPLPK